MENNRILSALSYFSVLFAPFILPIIVFFVSQDTEVKHHAKRSLISHLIPFGFMIILFIALFSSFFSVFMNAAVNEQSLFMASAPFLFILLYLVSYIIILVWNIIQGVKVLR
ncbi:DUF4870 domain-containing protein [Psychrobacillus sp. FJAT-21963]|uniref:DUF4870 domain-containing protein n=1 Tax=Bacillaceae TaxID=186817 RepID=UPI0006F4F9CA|nr:DUF4870 domain-containing protein [Psychrobacillus sp. FJAT-21963]KQL32448.1 hypothetical protein AN959_19510 [Psychrobacillus sp. FJAT-21963]